MSDHLLLSSIGMVAGALAMMLGVAQLTCEHAESTWLPRFSTVLLSGLSAWTAIDSWDAWAGVAPAPDPKTVAFTVVLAVSWAHRRVYGLLTAGDHRRARG